MPAWAALCLVFVAYVGAAELGLLVASRHHNVSPVWPASDVAGDRERCLAAGMDDYVTKPIRPSDLARVMRAWCPDGRAAARS